MFHEYGFIYKVFLFLKSERNYRENENFIRNGNET